MGPDTVAWMKAQGDYTRSVFDSIAPRAALLQRIADFAGRFGFVHGYSVHGGRAFYEERAPGADEFDLMVRDANGDTRTLVDIAALRASNGGMPYAINYFLPAPDGSKVAVGISAGGSEAASLFVYDAASGAQIAGPVDRAEFGATSWSADAQTLYFIRLKKLESGAPPTEKYLDSSIEAWNLKSDPVPILGRTVGRGPTLDPVENPALIVVPDAPQALLLAINGVQNEFTALVCASGSGRRPHGRLATVLQSRRRHYVDRTAGRRSIPAVASGRSDVQGAEPARSARRSLPHLRSSPLNRIV